MDTRGPSGEQAALTALVRVPLGGEVEERIARLQQLLASPAPDRDDDTLTRTLRNLEQLRAEMSLVGD